MKRITFLATTLLLFLSFALSAQQRGQRENMTPEQQSAKMIERLNQELKLTAKQQADLKTFFTASFKKKNENFRKNKDNREAMRESMKKDRETMDAEMKKILTAEQYNTYKANEEKRMQERKDKGMQSGKEHGRNR